MGMKPSEIQATIESGSDFFSPLQARIVFEETVAPASPVVLATIPVPAGTNKIYCIQVTMGAVVADGTVVFNTVRGQFGRNSFGDLQTSGPLAVGVAAVEISESPADNLNIQLNHGQLGSVYAFGVIAISEVFSSGVGVGSFGGD
jgi:hypothetical protein